MTTTTSLPAKVLHDLTTALSATQARLAERYPGEPGTRQPVHTVYGGAHLFRHDTAKKLGELGLRVLRQYAPDAATFASAIGLESSHADTIYERVLEKMQREAVEDFRIDFEDGYGNRSDAEEDGHAVQAGEEVARGMKEGTLPPFIGIRIKTLSGELCARALRTLDVFVTTVVRNSGGHLPDNFVVTLPKITSPEHVTTLVATFEALESSLALLQGSLKMEFMIETTQSILDVDGSIMLPRMLTAAQGRCVAAHFGVYDFTASNDITAQYQRMGHPACDFARHMMKMAYAGTGLWLSDGATNIMPVAPHRAEAGGTLTAEQTAENRKAVHAAWKLHADDIFHSLESGYYQGWDLHPGQLPTRYAATYAFFLRGLASASERLSNFVSKAAQATLVGDIFDDAATGQGLLNFFLRGINCGALKEEEALRAGVTLDELRGRSFVKILKNRRGLA
ncbi:MAG TPA: phosphoenolpyruvate kinase [Nannocystis sp.]|jgi:citrate lyase beta subunit